MAVTAPHLRIGEVARRTGVSPALRRAPEGRYGLLEPERTAGGTRLYDDGDVHRVHTMLGHLRAGMAAAEGARAALASPPGAFHDLGLVLLAVGLKRRGWSVTLLGANSPLETVADAAGRPGAELLRQDPIRPAAALDGGR